MNFFKTTAMAAVLLPAVVVAQEPADPAQLMSMKSS